MWRRKGSKTRAERGVERVERRVEMVERRVERVERRNVTFMRVKSSVSFR